MDNRRISNIIASMIEAGERKANLASIEVLIRAVLAGAFIGFATSLAVIVTSQTGLPVLGAFVFPIGFIFIILLSLELGTGNFALLPMVRMSGRQLSKAAIGKNLCLVLAGNLAGALIYSSLFYLAYSHGPSLSDGVRSMFIAIGEAKTLGYLNDGMSGTLSLFLKGVLCNWMVCIGVAMAYSSTSTVGKIVAAWLPIFTFVALGFEHSIVNMAVIPLGWFYGADVGAMGYVYNLVVVTLGNLVGAYVFVALPFVFGFRSEKGQV